MSRTQMEQNILKIFRVIPSSLIPLIKKGEKKKS